MLKKILEEIDEYIRLYSDPPIWIEAEGTVKLLQKCKDIIRKHMNDEARQEKYFTDDEYRILLSALRREDEVCKRVDKDCGDGHKLIKIMTSIKRKIRRLQYEKRWIPYRNYGGWIPVEDFLPECEQEVYIITEQGTRTTAMYENGTMSDDESIWNWTDIDFDYDEENDINFIPEGWWEYRHFNPDDVYNNAIDEKVIAWQPLPEPYRPEKGAGE